MKSKTIGYRLMEALTKDRIVHILDAIFDLWGSRKIDHKRRKNLWEAIRRLNLARIVWSTESTKRRFGF